MAPHIFWGSKIKVFETSRKKTTKKHGKKQPFQRTPNLHPFPLSHLRAPLSERRHRLALRWLMSPAARLTLEESFPKETRKSEDDEVGSFWIFMLFLLIVVVFLNDCDLLHFFTYTMLFFLFLLQFFSWFLMSVLCFTVIVFLFFCLFLGLLFLLFPFFYFQSGGPNVPKGTKKPCGIAYGVGVGFVGTATQSLIPLV